MFDKNFDLFDKDSMVGFLNMNEDVGLIQESPENNILLAEAILSDALNSEELSALCEDSAQLAMLQDENLLSEKSIIKFDKAAKLKRAEAQACIIIAREKKDRDLNKLLRVWKMRKLLLDRLFKKYGNSAKQRAKLMVRNMSKSKSPAVKKAAERVGK